MPKFDLSVDEVAVVLSGLDQFKQLCERNAKRPALVREITDGYRGQAASIALLRAKIASAK